MPFSLRLDPKTEAIIRAVTSRTGLSKAQVVREAVAQYVVGVPPATPASAFDAVRPYAGVIRARGANYSVDTHRKYRQRLTKHRARRSR